MGKTGSYQRQDERAFRMITDGYLGYWIALEPQNPQPTLNRCPCMRRVWELLILTNSQ